MGMIMRINKFIIFGLTIMFCLMVAGCAESNDNDESYELSSTLSSSSQLISEEGIELPEQEFASTEESNSYESNAANTNREDDVLMSSSLESSKESSLSQSGNTSSSTEIDEISLGVENGEENTSSDDISDSLEKEDGSIELPFDKW